MLLNDYARCRGALMETDVRGYPTVYMHGQCTTCRRYTDVVPNENYVWQRPPLGMLAGEDAQCERRIGA